MGIFEELKRRNVFRVAVAYVITSWLFVQALELAADSFEAPPWVMKMIITFLMLGFIPALLFSWAYELTPEGIKREHEVDRSTSVTGHTGRKLDYVTLAAAVGVAGLFLWQQFGPPSDNTLSTTTESVTNTEEIIAPATYARPDAVDKDDRSIAVLPFANMANNPENEPFTVGIHDDLLTSLSKIQALRVISRTSVLRYKDTQKPIREIADELGVAAVLEGGVQRAGNQIRINVQLIDAKTDEHLWAEKYDRELTTANIFEIQSEISGHIADALEAQLTPEEVASIEKAPTDNLDAYNAYLAGRQRMLKRTSESLEEALTLFSRAIDLDPDFALAYSGKADSISLLNEYGDISFEQVIADGLPLIEKALELNPMLAEAHTSLGEHYKMSGESLKSEKSFKKSLSLNPNYAQTYHWYGNLMRREGRPKEALELHRQAAVLDPLSPVIQANVGWSLQANFKYDEALAQFERTHELDPGYPGALSAIGNVHLLRGNLVDSIIWQKKVIELDPGNINQRVILMFRYLDLHDNEMAKATLEEASQISPEHEIIQIGWVYLDLTSGNFDSAYERIKKPEQFSVQDPWYQDLFATCSAFTGDYQTAIDIWKKQLEGDQPGSINLNHRNMNSVIFLVWALQESGRTSEASKIIIDSLAMIDNLPQEAVLVLGFDKASLLALKGDLNESANALSEAIDAGVRSNAVNLQVSPWYEPLHDNPIFKNAMQRVHDDLAKQRQRLKELESKTPAT